MLGRGPLTVDFEIGEAELKGDKRWSKNWKKTVVPRRSAEGGHGVN